MESDMRKTANKSERLQKLKQKDQLYRDACVLLAIGEVQGADIEELHQVLTGRRGILISKGEVINCINRLWSASLLSRDANMPVYYVCVSRISCPRNGEEFQAERC